ncbi:MAG: hypothetical protein ABIQ32_14010 [Sphingomicrobium sp.]
MFRFTLPLLICAAATIAATGPDAQTPAPAKKADEDKQICRRETPIGSIVSVKVCMTKKEWAQREEDGSGDVERLRGRAQRTMGSMNR